MDFSPLYSFLSEEGLSAHVAYYERLKLEYSILEVSEPSLRGVAFTDIPFLHIDRNLCSEAYEKRRRIDLHELYFSSFAEREARCDYIPPSFRSVAEMAYELFCLAVESESADFLVVTGDRMTGRVDFTVQRRLFKRQLPLLALDLCEHAYFGDYGFSREKYLKNAVSHLDFSRVSRFIEPFVGAQRKKGLH